MHLLGSKGGEGSGCLGTLDVHCWVGGGTEGLGRRETEEVCLGVGSSFGMRYLRLPFLLIMLSIFSGGGGGGGLAGAGARSRGLAGAGARLRCFFAGRVD